MAHAMSNNTVIGIGTHVLSRHYFCLIMVMLVRTAAGSENSAYLSPHKGRGHILKLQDCERGQLLVDALKDMVIQVPGLMQLCISS